MRWWAPAKHAHGHEEVDIIKNERQEEVQQAEQFSQVVLKRGSCQQQPVLAARDASAWLVLGSVCAPRHVFTYQGMDLSSRMRRHSMFFKR